MDINTLLAELREKVQTALAVGYNAQVKMTVAQLNTMLIDIAEDFDNLDVWLSRGGFKPDAWQSQLTGPVSL